MTTLAIIGAGIAGRSLIYALAKEKKTYSKIVVFDSDIFAPTCAFRSTATVCTRGVTRGHSPLGDLIVEGIATFQKHVEEDQPLGIYPIKQYTGAITKLEQFKKRFVDGEVQKTFAHFELNESTYVSIEDAHMIDPAIYLKWLRDQSTDLNVEVFDDFVVQVDPLKEKVLVKTQSAKEYVFDKVVICGGAASRFWGHPKTGKPAQGSYLEFSGVDFGLESFALTLEGDNLVYHAHTKKLLIGSTTEDLVHELPVLNELVPIYQRLSQRVQLNLPALKTGRVVTGLREKAAKRSPYLFHEGLICWFGGLYKNGYSLSLHLAKKLAREL